MSKSTRAGSKATRRIAGVSSHPNRNMTGSRLRRVHAHGWLAFTLALSFTIGWAWVPPSAFGATYGPTGFPELSGTAASPERPSPPDDPARELALLLRGLDQTHRLLYVTAHPDDEDAGLLAKLTHGMGVEVALLTLTRGEGGQNEIGPELFHALGVLRTRELETAGRYTGVRQYLSRAFDFGYSFSVEETYDKWGRESILKDIVAVIREFRPDVILTMMPEGEGGGQHHQASARLTAEAFDVAATDRWTRELALGPHQPRRLFRQIWGPESPRNLCEIELGEYDGVLGASYEAVGMESRAAHKCQGMARYSSALPRRVSRWEWVKAAGEEPRRVAGFFDGLESLPDGARPFYSEVLQPRIESLRRTHQPGHETDLLDALLELRRTFESHPVPTDSEDPTWLAPKLEQTLRRIDRAVVLASGLHLRARSLQRYHAAGDSMRVLLYGTNVGDRPLEVECHIAGHGIGGRPATSPDRPHERIWRLDPGAYLSDTLVIPLNGSTLPSIATPVSRDSSKLDTWRSRHPAWTAYTLHAAIQFPGEDDPIHHAARVGCQERNEEFPTIFYSDPQLVPDPSIRPRRATLPYPIVARNAPGPAAKPPGAGAIGSHDMPEPSVHVDLLVSSIDGGDVIVRAHAPDGWIVDPTEERISTSDDGSETPVQFQVRRAVDVHAGQSAADRSESERVATADSERLSPFDVTFEAHYAGDSRRASTQGYQRIEYPHIRPGTLLHEARARLVPMEVAVPEGLRIGYVEGVGDQVPEAFAALGLELEFLQADDLLENDLSPFDVIITGVRAYKVRDDLRAAQPRLMKWVEDGGTFLVQYNKFEFNSERTVSSPFAPFPRTLVGRRRVTVEDAPVRVNHPDHPVFHEPNRIGESDWTGWVQERGLYFLDVTDDRYLDLITMEDPVEYNAGEKGGALVLAPYGKGEWVYLGIGLFRQLPAAVPGAYRILANLVALGADRGNRH